MTGRCAQCGSAVRLALAAWRCDACGVADATHEGLAVATLPRVELARVETKRGTLTFWASWYGWAALWFACGWLAG